MTSISAGYQGWSRIEEPGYVSPHLLGLVAQVEPCAQFQDFTADVEATAVAVASDSSPERRLEMPKYWK